MKLTPHKLRELSFHLLYATHFHNDPRESPQFFMEYHRIPKKNFHEAQAIVGQVSLLLKEIDALIQTHALDYELARIPSVEKNLLRLAIFELIQPAPLPAQVVISEAMRLARKFASVESCKFINAVLDAIYQRRAV